MFRFLLTSLLLLTYSSIHAFEDTPPDGYEFVSFEDGWREIKNESSNHRNYSRSVSENVPDSNNAMKTLEAGPSCVVAGCVNTITGSFFDSHLGMTVLNPQPLIVQSFYCSTEKEWKFEHMPELEIGLSNSGNHLHACYVDDHGSGITYRIKENNIHTGGMMNKKFDMTIPSKLFEKRITNCGSGIISGKTNWKNSYFSLVQQTISRKKTYILKHSSNVKRVFVKKKNQHERVRNASIGKFFLENENYPCGNYLLCHYNDSEELKFVTAHNKSNLELGRLSVVYHKDAKHVTWLFGCISVDYKFEDKGRTQLKEIIPSHTIPVSYEYNKSDLLSKKNMPNGRFLEIEYEESKGKKRVSKLTTPLGLAYSFHYNRQNNHTIIYDGEKNQSQHSYDKKTKRLKSVRQYSNQEFTYYYQDNFYWTPTGELTGRTFLDNKNCYFHRALDYDDFGNVKQNSLYGNLTGTSAPLIMKDENVTSSCDVYTQTYVYSDNELNQLLEENDSKKLILYDYYPNQLLKSRLTKYQDKIVKREFFEYDVNGVLVKEILDDGESQEQDVLFGVTERHVKLITPRKEHPIGLPEMVEEMYLDLASNQQKILRVTVNLYSPVGKLEKQYHYDNNVKLIYCLEWNYDNLGNVTKKIDALGHITTYGYDANGNKVLEEGPRLGYKKAFEYDLCNRLIKETEYWPDGTVLITTHGYNKINQRIATTDPQGHVTTFKYNALGHLLKTEYPSFFINSTDTIQPVVECKYDAMGNVIENKDANGNITKTAFTIRGQPYRIEYSDGTVEQKEYSLDGLLVKEIAKNGLITTYEYDCFDRVIATCITDPQEMYKKTTSATYSTFQLLTETDEEGVTTFYKYDGAGRCISVKKGGHLTEYEYDSLGRKVKTINKIDDSNVRITCNAYDLLNQIVEERIEDEAGNVLKREQYGYDVDGNKSSIKRFTQAGVAETVTEYYPNGSPAIFTNALGKQTKYFYDHAFIYKGQKVTKITKVDPLGNQELKIYDTQGNICCQMQLDPFGSIIQCEKSYYDPCGQKQLSEITVYQGSEPKNIIEIAWKYNSMGDLTGLVEAVGTPKQKTVSHIYNEYGQKEETQMPNGVSILNEYDVFGRLSSYKSSDGTIHYKYTYDEKDRPILVEDLIHKTATVRSYDADGRLKSETLDNGLTLSYTYDLLDRPITVTLPDQTAIRYRYDSLNLTGIDRIKGNKVAYTHSYDQYDLSGNVIDITLLEQTGTIHYNYDLLERPISVQAPHWQETVPEDGFDALGNLLKRVVTDDQGSLNYTYAYDTLNQLISEDGYFSHTYQNDSIYNRTAKDSQPYSVNVLNQLESQTDSTYIYDNNGNLIEANRGKEKVRYIYDALDRLIELRKGTDVTKYTYDSFHRRLSKTHNDLKTLYIYQNQNEIGALNQGKINQLRVLGMSYGAEIGGAVALELNDVTYVPIHDPQGNVIVLIDSNGNLVESYKYSSFGESKTLSKKTLNNPWKYSSKRFDDESGFIYFGRRYYEPTIGKWTTADPAGFVDGPNLYAYVHNRPLIYIDPNGLFIAAACQAVVGAFMAFGEGMQEGSMNINLDERSSHFDGEKGVFYNCGLELGTFNAPMERALGGIMGYLSTSNPEMTRGELPFAPGGLMCVAESVNCVVKSLLGEAKYVGFANQLKCAQSAQAAVALESVEVTQSQQILKNAGPLTPQKGIVTKDLMSSAALSSKAGANFAKHLEYWEDYGKANVKFLQNGRIRYYKHIKPSDKPGQMIGMRYVHEFNPEMGSSRGWLETIDSNFQVRQVRPQLGPAKGSHYLFDGNGNLEKIW